MSYLVAPYCPEYLLSTRKGNERQARYLAAEELADLINNYSLGLKVPNGFNTKQLIKIEDDDLMPENKDQISTAVETLAKFSDSKQKMQRLYEQSLDSREHIKLLFDKKFLSDEEFSIIQKSLKIIKSYAMAASAYKEASANAQDARTYLEKTLKSAE